MARHGFGRGEYKYYRYPLPPLIAELRPALYERLVPDRQRLAGGAGVDRARYPDRHEDFLAQCHAGRPEAADAAASCATARATTIACIRTCTARPSFRCRSRCCYRARRDFSGGEFVLTEQRPRQAIARRGGAAGAGRCRGLRGARAAGARNARLLPGPAPARRQRGSFREASHIGRHLSRRRVRIVG